MTDRFNKKAQELLRAGNENGGLTIKSLFDLQVAAHEEAVETARLISDELRATRKEDHIALERITNGVEEECEKVSMRLATVETTFAGLECIKHPRKPHRSYDEPGTDYRDKSSTRVTPVSAADSAQQKTLAELFLGYGVVKWALTITVGALIIFGVNYAANRATVLNGQTELKKAILEETQKSRDRLREDLIAEEQMHREQLKADILDAIERANK